jgi:DNA repair exonuclease SbcCD ATPase subunit
MKITEIAVLAVAASVTAGMTTFGIIQKRKNAKLKKQLLKIEDGMDELKDNNSNLVSKNNKLNKTVSGLEEYKGKIENELNTVKGKEANLKEKVKELNEKLKVAEEIINSDKGTISDLNETNGIYEKLIADQERIIADQANTILNLKVDLDKYMPENIKAKKTKEDRTFKFKSLKNMNKNINYTTWAVTIETNEKIQRPMISDGYFHITEKGAEKIIMIKRDASQQYNNLRSLISKCITVTDIFALHNNNDENIMGA